MKVTNVILPCQKCVNEFLLIMNDDNTVTPNHCPHCGNYNEIKLRVADPTNYKDNRIKAALQPAEAKSLLDAKMIGQEEDSSDRVTSFLDHLQNNKKLLPVIDLIMQKRTEYLHKYGWTNPKDNLTEIIELSDDLADAFLDKLFDLTQ